MVSHSYHRGRPYVPKRGEYGEYYASSQFGGTQLPAYRGVSRQRGHGTGLITDLLSGKNLKSSLVDRTKSAARSAAAEIAETASSYLNRREPSPPPKRQRTSLGDTPTDKKKKPNKSKKKKKKKKPRYATLF